MSRKRGPKRTSPTLLKLRGSRIKGRADTVKTGAGTPPRCPPWLDEHGKAEWRRVVRDLGDTGLLTGSNQSSLAGLCQSWSLFVRMSERVDEMLAKPTASMMDVRRMAAIASDALKNYARLAGSFGVTPMDRQKLDAPERAVPDAMDSYLKGV